MSILSKIPRSYKLAVKAKVFEARRLFVQTLMSYDEAKLLAALREVGVQAGDSVMLHSAFAAHHGFRGTIESLTQVFIDAVGPTGHLLMVSLPYRSSSLQYLSTLTRFDVRRTPSMMGLVSELFRRRPDVMRSVHPTHPILARGPRAASFLDGHAACLHPCGPGTPFHRLAEADGKAVFFNVPFGTFTFFHYLEHLVSADLPFPLYTDEPFRVAVIDSQGQPGTVTTYVYALDAIRRRRFEILENEVRRRGLIKERRIGNGSVLAVKVRDVVACVEEMRSEGRYFYDFTGLPAPRRAAATSEAGA
jgi:aminoglycoside 3-N-acetyltransferase